MDVKQIALKKLTQNQKNILRQQSRLKSDLKDTPSLDSPDLSPANFFIFQKLKLNFRRRVFEDMWTLFKLPAHSALSHNIGGVLPSLPIALQPNFLIST